MKITREATLLCLVSQVMLNVLIRSTIWADQAPIRLSNTPTVSSIASSEIAEPSDINSQKKTISFQLNLDQKANVELDIFNSQGKQVAVIKKVMPAGPGTVIWNCASVPPGTFQVRLKLDGKRMKTKINLVK
jgi:hypothetical protein